jgi:glycerophosphoryl diester phosphodiesterase
VHRLRVYGHRGASALLPENTIEGFRRALADGANALEMDVHRTADGHFVVIHDANGLRTAGVADRVTDSSLSQVTTWDAGVGFVDADGDRPFAGRGFAVPELIEVLETFEDVPLSIDLKPTSLQDVPPFLELLASRGAQARVTICSFHERVTAAVRALGYPGRTALTRLEVAALWTFPLPLCRRLVRGHSLQVPLRAGPFRLDRRRLMQRCRTLGLRADFWVVNDPKCAAALIAGGATGVMTDDPALIVEALARIAPNAQR